MPSLPDLDAIAGLTGRVVIVSPHLDDAVLSLGASIARAAKAGASIEVLTVFAGDPASSAPAGPWDERSHFISAGQAAQQRREEDRMACAILGAKPHWLSYCDEQYDRRGGETEIHSAILSVTAGANAILVPGFPLTNPDHAWLSNGLLRQGLNCSRVGLYAEQPYMFTNRRKIPHLGSASPLGYLITGPLIWSRLASQNEFRRAKLHAVRAYRSQLPQLGLAGLGLYRMLWHETARGGEAIAWLS